MSRLQPSVDPRADALSLASAATPLQAVAQLVLDERPHQQAGEEEDDD
jgi:hypothetical protein